MCSCPAPHVPPQETNWGSRPFCLRNTWTSSSQETCYNPRSKRNGLMFHRTKPDTRYSQSRDSSDSQLWSAFPPAIVNRSGRVTPGRLALPDRRYAKMYSEGRKETLFYSSLPTPRRWWFESPLIVSPVLSFDDGSRWWLSSAGPTSETQKQKQNVRTPSQTTESESLWMGPKCLFLKSSLGDPPVFWKLRTTRWNEASCPEINICLASWWSALGRTAKGCGQTARPKLPSS